MARVVAVHGILQTYGGPQLMAGAWGPALMSGVELAGGRGLLRPDDVRYVFYGDVFRPPGRMLGPDDELAALDPSDVETPEEAELVAAWWAAAARVEPGAVPPPDGRSLGALTRVQTALAAIASSRFLAGISERFLILWLRQVRDYFTVPAVRETVQERFAQAVGPDTEVVAAHSLGSVVAYEALCRHPDWGVRHLVTLGSPLAVRNLILDRLDPPPTELDGHLRASWPGSVRRWTNICDAADFVALEKRLRTRFGDGVVDIEIDNGTRVHDATRYLTAVETGAAIIEGVRQPGGVTAD